MSCKRKQNIQIIDNLFLMLLILIVIVQLIILKCTAFERIVFHGPNLNYRLEDMRRKDR